MSCGIERIALFVFQKCLDGFVALIRVVFDEGVQPCACIRSAQNSQMIRAITRLALATVNHRIVESADVPRCFPDFWIHDDRAVDADDVNGFAVWSRRIAAHNIFPPCVFEIALQFGAKRTVIPEAVDAAINFGTLKDESAAAAECDNFIH